MKILILNVILFAGLVLLFVYPSFYTSPPIDCLAGCSGIKGLPLNYYDFSGGAFGSELNIDMQNLILDVIFWNIVSSIVTFAIAKKLLNSKH